MLTFVGGLKCIANGRERLASMVGLWVVGAPRRTFCKIVRFRTELRCCASLNAIYASRVTGQRLTLCKDQRMSDWGFCAIAPRVVSKRTGPLSGFQGDFPRLECS
jgi:hypothetical protein